MLVLPAVTFAGAAQALPKVLSRPTFVPLTFGEVGDVRSTAIDVEYRETCPRRALHRCRG